MKYCVNFSICFLFLIIVQASKAQTNSAEKEISTIWEKFRAAWENLDAKACSNFYFLDGINVPPEPQENIGRNAIENFYQELFDAHQSSKYEHHTRYIEQGDMMIEYGEFHVDWKPKQGDPWQYHARVMVHWKKDANDDWKIRALIFNKNP